MKRLIKVFFLTSAIMLMAGCDDVFEEDITNDLVVKISPDDDSIITGNSVQFRWEFLENTDDYRIQVVNEEKQRILLDSLVSNNSFILSLNPGKYNWRVRAENFAYTTAYTFPSSFTMVSSEDLSDQTVFLSSPALDFYTNKDTVILTWEVIDAANSYYLEVDKTIQGNTVTDFQLGDISSTNYTLDTSVLEEDAIYIWKVKAVNQDSETSFSSRRILLDRQIPNQPVLTAPSNEETTTDTVNFVWSKGNDIGEVTSPRISVVEIATDINFVTVIRTEEVEDDSTEILFSSNGDYYWRVTTIDLAGNRSVISEVRKFTVQ